MSPPREHPGSDASFADSSRFTELRARLNRGSGVGGLSIDDVLGGSLDAGEAARELQAPTDEVSAEELLDWFEAEPGEARLPQRPDAGPSTPGDRLPVLSTPSALAADPETPSVVRPSGVRNRYRRRRYGVAPFVKPSARRSRRKRRRDYRQLGFVELTPEKLRLRHRVLPRTVLGTSVVLVALGVGAAFSGAAFYAYYDWRTSQSEAQSKAFAEGFEATFAGATEQLELQRNQAIDDVTKNLEPLRAWVNDTNAVTELPAKVGAGVFSVRTLDPAGKPSVGTAFVVSSSANETLLLTSYNVVTALTAKPSPPLTIEKNGDTFSADLWSWDADRDLALLKTTRGNLPQLEWAPDGVRSTVTGTRVYGVNGIGGQGATAAPGMAIDASQAGIRHDTPLSPEFRGGPLVNAAGQVLGVLTTNYTPTGIDVGELPYSPFITSACERVLKCPAGVTATAPAATPSPGG